MSYYNMGFLAASSLNYSEHRMVTISGSKGYFYWIDEDTLILIIDGLRQFTYEVTFHYSQSCLSAIVSSDDFGKTEINVSGIPKDAIKSTIYDNFVKGRFTGAGAFIFGAAAAWLVIGKSRLESNAAAQ